MFFDSLFFLHVSFIQSISTVPDFVSQYVGQMASAVCITQRIQKKSLRTALAERVGPLFFLSSSNWMLMFQKLELTLHINYVLGHLDSIVPCVGGHMITLVMIAHHVSPS